MRKTVGCLVCVAALAACATPSRYEWGDYERSLYGYARSPELRDQYEQSLRDAIDVGEKTNRVAPGIYAELGYLLLEEGDERGAAEAFEREMELFPESRAFIERVMGRTTLADNAETDR
ncbi:DUF4810 domain-containing protein [Parvularcula dongshanensis]|uniref:DUF4810 domain-containing protein n=1 Tax=Parvularcula dongshanensis TaxID=1173995 RepID=A0A840I3S1_9PROT|nr:DUF4810 domain-containing protein [Parvularcula dongshanensis]MBB4659427.1 hypothetical protein [Parvularcula dongshanensis]